MHPLRIAIGFAAGADGFHGRAMATRTPLAMTVFAAAIVLAACDEHDDGRPRLDTDELVAPPADPRGGAEQGTITPVLFVPVGEAPTAEQIAALHTGLADVWGWYDRELGDAHLRVAPLEIVYGQHDAATYLGEAGDPSDIWALGPDEIRDALGFGPWDGGHIVLLVGVGLSGWAGGAGNGNAGFAVLGLESLANTPRCSPNWWCTPEMWRGTAIHELGHALTLPHSVEPSIMAFHDDWQQRILLPDPEVETVRALPFVAGDVGPVDPEPEPVPEPDGGCGDVDYAGLCDGERLVWCEAETLRVFDCANVGMECGWQDEIVGNNCL